MDKWIENVVAVAPGLATALGGPLVGAAVSAIAAALGRPGASQDEIAEILNTGALTPDQIVALRTAEKDLQVEMARVEQAREAAFIADTASARNQTIELARESSGIAYAAPVISTVIVVGFFASVYLLFFIQRNWDERTANLLNVLFGALIPGFSQVCNYWLGSSAGSKKNGDAVRAIAEKSTPPSVITKD